MASTTLSNHCVSFVEPAVKNRCCSGCSTLSAYPWNAAADPLRGLIVHPAALDGTLKVAHAPFGVPESWCASVSPPPVRISIPPAKGRCSSGWPASRLPSGKAALRRYTVRRLRSL